jgi:hypothetical protein
VAAAVYKLKSILNFIGTTGADLQGAWVFEKVYNSSALLKPCACRAVC